MSSRKIAIAATSLTLALPATAAAQSAGDNQYVDPLAGQHQHAPSGSSQSAGGSGASSSAPSSAAPSSSAPSSSAPSSSAAPTAAPATSSGPQQAVPLAHTGFDAWIPAVAGIALLGCALLLRRSAKAPQR